jgi:hypothetical protein
MLKFKCTQCSSLFEAEGVKDEYLSPIYGPCWKMIAECPDCKTICDEFRVLKKEVPKTESSCSGCCSNCSLH